MNTRADSVSPTDDERDQDARLAPSVARPDFARAAVVAGLRLLSVLAGLAYVKYYTTALSMEQVGAFFSLGTLSYVLNAVVFVPVDSYMQARVSHLEALPWRALLRLVGVTLLVALGICAALSLPFIAMGLLAARDMPLLYGLAALLYLCSSLRNLLNIRGQATFAAGMIVLESVARLLAFALAAWAVGASARSLLCSSILALVAELMVLFWQARRSLPLSAETLALDRPIRVLHTTSALAGGAVSNIVQLQAYRVIFPASGHANTAATLGVTSNIGAVAMSACAQVFSQLVLPRLYQTRAASVGQYVRRGAAVAIAMLAIALPFSEFIVRHLTDVKYVPYANAIGVGIVIEAGNLLIGAYGVYLTLHGRAGALFRFQLGGALLSLIGCLTLLVCAPASTIGLGVVIAASQLAITPALAFYVHRLQRLDA